MADLLPGIRLSYAQPAQSATIAPKPRIHFDGCPLCTSHNTRTLRTADCSRHRLYRPILPRKMTWMQCNDCSHVFTDGYFSLEVAKVIFEHTHDNQRPGWEFEKQRRVSARMVESVARYVKNGSWLDVGFGNGSLLFTAEEWGFAPVGLDLRPSSVEAMKRLGVEAHCADIAAFSGAEQFSVISMADVLEHMPFPQNGLAAAK